MQEYRAYIMGPDGHVHKRVDLRCSDERRLCEPSNLLTATTSSYGNWID